MVWDRGVFYYPSYLLFILMSYWSGYNPKQLAAIDHTILQELLDVQMTLSWHLLPQHYEWCLIPLVSLPLTITSSLIQEKHSLFSSLNQAPHPVQLLHRSSCFVVNLSHWLTEPPIWVISCVLIYLMMIFWGFKLTCHRANCLLSTFSVIKPAVKTLLFCSTYMYNAQKCCV